MTKWIMFYSYKGGTGRTSAVLNVAALLAQLGCKTGVVDLDFDAPGLAALFDIDTNEHDFLKLIVNHAPVAEIEAHVVDVDLGEDATIYCLPCSGNIELIDKIKWDDAKITRYLRDALKSFASTYDLEYILLDTRSGISHTAAFAVQQSTHAILVCRMDRQNKLGLAKLRSVCRERSLPYSIVANSVPLKSRKLPNALKEFKEAVDQLPDILVPYDSRLYFQEIISAHLKGKAKTKIGQAYKELTERIRSED